MRKICIINQKGGVAKTTTTINLGMGLAKEGKKVLLIDLDAQGNIGTCLPAESKKDLYDLLVENADIRECISGVNENLDIIKSRETLAKAELILVGESSREMTLRRKLQNIAGYDYILLDCPPSLGLLNQNAMLFASEALIPASTDILGIDALRKMRFIVEKINDVFGHTLVISKVVPTLYDVRNKVCNTVLKQMQSEFYELVTDPIRVNATLKEAPAEKKSIFEYAPNSRGAEDYRKLVTQVLRDEEKYNKMAGRASAPRLQVKEAVIA